MAEKRKNFTEKEKKKWKLITLGITLIATANVIVYLVFMFSNLEPNFYTKHLLVPIVLLTMSSIAFITPYVNKYSSYKASTRNDNFMYVIGIILIFLTIISLIGSFIR